MSSSRTIRYLRYPVRAMKFSLWMVTFVGHTLYYLLFGALEGQGPGAGSQRGAIPANARPASPLEECVVCRDEPNFFPRGPPTAACSHNSEVCFVCLRRTVDEAITSGRYTGDGTQIQCPSVNCGSHMGRDEISDWASPEVFQRYNQAMLTSTFINNTLYVPCLNCQAGQIHAGGDDEPIVRCHACGALQCFRHRVPWHSGLSCKEWEKKNKDYKRNDKLSKKIILSSTKPCPKCGRRIEKSQGCDHMTCQRPTGCGHEFCWVCFVPWGDIRRFDNSRHYDDCRYYSGRPNANPAPAHLRPTVNRRWWQFWKKDSDQ